MAPKRKIFRFAAFMVCLAPVLSTSPGNAKPLPKKFSFDHTLFATVNHAADWRELDFGKAGSAWVARWTHVAIDRGDAHFRHNTTGHCIGSGFHKPDGGLEGGGFCYSIDQDGDKIFERWKFTAEGKGTGEYFGGTGKYAGIKCSHHFRRVMRPKASAKGIWQLIGREFGTCTLP